MSVLCMYVCYGWYADSFSMHNSGELPASVAHWAADDIWHDAVGGAGSRRDSGGSRRPLTLGNMKKCDDRHRNFCY